jgi:hypothetical protein
VPPEPAPSVDTCPGCGCELDRVSLSALWRADGTLELIFCRCGTALHTRQAEPYLTDLAHRLGL